MRQYRLFYCIFQPTDFALLPLLPIQATCFSLRLSYSRSFLACLTSYYAFLCSACWEGVLMTLIVQGWPSSDSTRMERADLGRDSTMFYLPSMLPLSMFCLLMKLVKFPRTFLAALKIFLALATMLPSILTASRVLLDGTFSDESFSSDLTSSCLSISVFCSMEVFLWGLGAARLIACSSLMTSLRSFW